MNLEKSDTLDRHDTQEAMPNFQTNDTPPPGHRKSYGWLWFVVLALVGVGVYYFRSHGSSAKAASDSAQSPGGMPGRGRDDSRSWRGGA